METTTATLSGVSTTGPKFRKSCDSCHRRKLLCSRRDPAGSCDRCLAAKTPCIFTPKDARRKRDVGARRRDDISSLPTADAALLTNEPPQLTFDTLAIPTPSPSTFHGDTTPAGALLSPTFGSDDWLLDLLSAAPLLPAPSEPARHDPPPPVELPPETADPHAHDPGEPRFLTLPGTTALGAALTSLRALPPTSSLTSLLLLVPPLLQPATTLLAELRRLSAPGAISTVADAYALLPHHVLLSASLHRLVGDLSAAVGDEGRWPTRVSVDGVVEVSVSLGAGGGGGGGSGMKLRRGLVRAMLEETMEERRRLVAGGVGVLVGEHRRCGEAAGRGHGVGGEGEVVRHLRRPGLGGVCLVEVGADALDGAWRGLMAAVEGLQVE
ncbi:hypothetical protein HK101_007714 [Irineochytrium annulatum]|nr:hypothetical protein HK101_007714 [Irineochytrium annulatum]